jgi:hypothetical protein
MAELINLAPGPNQDSLYTGALKINQAILELALKIINAGGVPSIQAGLLADRPAATGSGAIYIATDASEKKFYRDDIENKEWELIGGGQVDWSNIEGKPDAFPPEGHAASHADGSSDAITPANIGALALAAFTWANMSGKPETFTPAAHKTSHATGQLDALTPSDIGAATAEAVAAKASKAGDTFTGDVLFKQQIQIGDTGIKLVKTADGVVDIQFATGSKLFKVDGNPIIHAGNFPVVPYAADETQITSTSTSYQSTTSLPKTVRMIKSSVYGYNIKKINVVAELWVNNASAKAYLQIKIDGVEKLVLTTQSTTEGNIVQGTIDVSDWVENSSHLIEANIKRDTTGAAFQRLLEFYVGVV